MGDLRTQHVVLALARFQLARQFQNLRMRGGYLAVQLRYRLLLARALLRVFLRAAFPFGNRLLQAVDRLLQRVDAFLRAVGANDECIQLQPAQLFAQGDVAPGRLALFLQGLQLPLQLLQDVFNAQQVLARVFHAALRLVFADLVFDDARRLFKHLTAIFGFGGEDLVDPALTDQRITLLANARIPEQIDDIPQAAGGLVQLIFAFAVAIDAPGYAHLGEIHRQRPVLVLKRQRYLAVSQPLALFRSAEDNILHAPAAQAARALLAQHPAHGVGYVRFAASVRPDDAGDPLVKDDLRAVCERLEAVDLQFF